MSQETVLKPIPPLPSCPWIVVCASLIILLIKLTSSSLEDDCLDSIACMLLIIMAPLANPGWNQGCLEIPFTVIRALGSICKK